MYWIAHRGNLYGREPGKENSPEYIESAIAKGFDVEIDVWWKDDGFFLGHDEPTYPVDLQFLNSYKDKLWVHAKNGSALSKLLTLGDSLHVFSHDVDPVVLTSRAIPWAYPGQPIDEHTICVMPERVKGAYTPSQLRTCRGVCSDYVGWYKQQAEASMRFGMIVGGRWNCHQENILRQVREYLSSKPHVWIDIHTVVNDEESKLSEYLQDTWMNAPFIATFHCVPFKVPEHYINHPKKRVETSAQKAVSMHYTNTKAFESLSNFNQYQYDLVIKYRPDIISNGLPDIERFLHLRTDASVIVTPYKHTYSGANDQIAIGSIAAMKEYCNVYPDIDYYLVNEHGYALHPETMLKFQLDKKHIRLQGFDYDYDLDNRRK